ncbi:sulfotransferase domain-containing protein [Planktotalea sp.]|uniref:sulfotransferase domain-containing protein n=1 Tax=Planktotalea sp. TaxID=2029877 RepID=UPI003D6B813B
MSAPIQQGKGNYWIASYPKSGNTWLRLFLETYMQNPEKPMHINDLPSGSFAYQRSTFDNMLGIETADYPPDLLTEMRPRVYDHLADPNAAQFIKTHERFTYTRSGEPVFSSTSSAGAILILRSPLDVAISMSHFLRMSIERTIARMAGAHESPNQTLTDSVPHQTGSWSNFAQSWLDGTLPLHVMRYEDMLDTPEETFSKALQFLKRPIDETRLQKAIAFTRFKTLQEQERKDSFATMRTGAKAFFRQGKKDIWQSHLSSAQQLTLQKDHAEMMHKFGYLK